MTETEELLHLDLVATGIEVVTVRNEDGRVVSRINAPGHRIDGELFGSRNDGEDSAAHHGRACVLARIAAYPWDGIKKRRGAFRWR